MYHGRMPPSHPGSADPAIQLQVVDPALQAYLQRYPFSTGPDAERNAQGIRALREGLFPRPMATPVSTTLLAPEDTHLAADEFARLQQLFQRVRLSAKARLKHTDDFEWEANQVPRTARNVLVIGCGDGIELLFLRSILPEAKITGIDYHDSLLPGIAEATGVSLLVGDMHAHLRSLARSYDLVFSNHTMEHLYNPDQTLATLRALLVPGGHIVSTLPMMAAEGTPFLARVRSFVASPEKKIHPLDLVFFDLGHPWKTNPSDIAATLARAGYSQIEVFQRREHLCRATVGPEAAIRQRRAIYRLLHAAFLDIPRTILKVLVPSGNAIPIGRLYFAVERRLPFGTNRFMNGLSEEALFRATVS